MAVNLADPFAVALAVKDCLCTSLATTLGGKVCRCSIYPSIVNTADICSKTLAGNGEAKVTIGRIFETRNFPNPDFLLKCDSYLAVEVIQTVWRCGPTINDAGQIPSIIEVENASMILMDDAKAMRCAIKCCLDTNLISVGEWQELQLQGGCMGGRLTSIVGIDQLPC